MLRKLYNAWVKAGLNQPLRMLIGIGEKRLVMFVGGGYDPIYEDPAAIQATSFW